MAERLRELGLILVASPEDVIRLDTLGVPTLGLCGAAITRAQAAKAARLARVVAGGVATVFLPCDDEGEQGMRTALGYLAQLIPVRLAWTSKMFGGHFAGRAPESLTAEEWADVRDYLMSGEPRGRTLD